MTINTHTAKLGVPYCMVRDGVEWTGIGYMRPGPADRMSYRPAPASEPINEWVMFRRLPNNTVSYQTTTSAPDFDSITPLVPARPVTRADLPSANDVLDNPFAASFYAGLIGRVLGAVVEHLNERGGIPAEPFGISDKLPSCCEEAQLTANELARRNEELSAAEGEIAAQRRLRDSEVEYWSGRAEKAEAERDEWKQGAEAEAHEADRLRAVEGRLTRERDAARDLAARTTAKWSEESAKVRELTAERNKLHRELSDVIEVSSEQYDELQVKLDAAENRPTLDRQKIADTLDHHFGTHSCSARSAALSDLMAFAPAAEGWPEWLGPLPEKSEAKREPDGYWKTGDWLINKSADPEYCREAIRHHIEGAAAHSAVLDAIESEQAATGDEDQRIARRISSAATVIDNYQWSRLDGGTRGEQIARALVNAGWTPPESEGE